MYFSQMYMSQSGFNFIQIPTYLFSHKSTEEHVEAQQSSVCSANHKISKMVICVVFFYMVCEHHCYDFTKGTLQQCLCPSVSIELYIKYLSTFLKADLCATICRSVLLGKQHQSANGVYFETQFLTCECVNACMRNAMNELSQCGRKVTCSFHWSLIWL